MADPIIYLAPGHGLDPRTGRVDPGAAGGGTNEQEAGDVMARAVQRELQDSWLCEVARQPRGGPNFRGTIPAIRDLAPVVAIELHHDWVRAPRGGFGFYVSRAQRALCEAIGAAYRQRSLPTRKHLTDLPGRNVPPAIVSATYPAGTVVVLWEIDQIGADYDVGEVAAAIAAGIARYAGLAARDTSTRPAPAPPPAPAPRSWVTVGDRDGDLPGTPVRDLQQQLARLLPDHPAAHAPDGIFGEQTRQLVLAAYSHVGLSAADPAEPRVGARSMAALRAAAPLRPVEPWRGKRVVARRHVRFYRRPGWHPDNRSAGVLQAGWGFRGGIHAKRTVGGGEQYQVSNSNGDRYWITASERYVRLLDA